MFRARIVTPPTARASRAAEDDEPDGFGSAWVKAPSSGHEARSHGAYALDS